MDVFEQMFSTFKISAQRIETLPNYRIEGGEWKEFSQFVEGKPIAGFANEDWIESLLVWKRDSKSIERIRVVPPNTTDYLRYEIEWCYPRNWNAGERIYFVSNQLYESIVKPNIQGDFWLFDKKLVLKMQYGPHGEYIGEKLIDDQTQAEAHNSLFQKLLTSAKPLDEILRKIRTTTIHLDLP